MDHWPAVSVIIPNYNGSDLLRRYLPSTIDACERYPGATDLIAVDDASTDDSLTVLKEFSQLRTVPRTTNRGFSAACNSGIEAARYGILCLVNSDVMLEADFMEPAVRYFEDPETFGVTPQGRTTMGASVDGCVMMRYEEVGRMREQERGAATRSDREIMALRDRFLAGEIVVDQRTAPVRPLSSFSRAV